MKNNYRVSILACILLLIVCISSLSANEIWVSVSGGVATDFIAAGGGVGTTELFLTPFKSKPKNNRLITKPDSPREYEVATAKSRDINFRSLDRHAAPSSTENKKKNNSWGLYLGFNVDMVPCDLYYHTYYENYVIDKMTSYNLALDFGFVFKQQLSKSWSIYEGFGPAASFLLVNGAFTDPTTSYDNFRGYHEDDFALGYFVALGVNVDFSSHWGLLTEIKVHTGYSLANHGMTQSYPYLSSHASPIDLTAVLGVVYKL